jgi:hypothetical protein
LVEVGDVSSIALKFGEGIAGSQENLEVVGYFLFTVCSLNIIVGDVGREGVNAVFFIPDPFLFTYNIVVRYFPRTQFPFQLQN